VLDREEREQPQVDQQRRAERADRCSVERLGHDQVADESGGVEERDEEDGVRGHAVDERDDSSHGPALLLGLWPAGLTSSLLVQAPAAPWSSSARGRRAAAGAASPRLSSVAPGKAAAVSGAHRSAEPGGANHLGGISRMRRGGSLSLLHP